nr:hypothetical protein [Tanacetum cinerariifolium]
MEESLTKFMAESTKRHEENSNIIKEIRASTDAAIRNQGASIKTLEVKIGQMSKVLQERGFRSIPSSTEMNPKDQVKSISTTKAYSTKIHRIISGPYVVSDSQFSKLFSKIVPFPTRLHDYCCDEWKEAREAKCQVTIKHPRGIAENMLVRIGKFISLIDFIILDIPEDNDVPLILGRPFLSAAHSKIDVFKRKFILRIGEEKLVFKSIKPATSIIRRVYMLKEGKTLDSKTKLVGEAINESFDPHYGSYIELNDLDAPLEPRINQDDKGDHEGNDLARTLIDIPIFVGNLSKGFTIIDDMDKTSGAGIDMLFCKKFVSCQKIMEKFTRRDECELLKEE